MTFLAILLIGGYLYGRARFHELYKFVFLLAAILLVCIPFFILIGAIDAADDIASVFVLLIIITLIEGVKSAYESKK